jgi:hypothetical protein
LVAHLLRRPAIALLTISLLVAALFYSGRKAALFPFIDSKPLYFTVFALSFALVWALMFRHRRAYWSDTISKYPPVRVLVTGFGIAAFPLLVGVTLNTQLRWLPYHFAATEERIRTTVMEVTPLQRFRVRYWRVVLLAESNSERLVIDLRSDHGALAHVDEGWVGKRVCIAARSNAIGSVVEHLSLC